MITVTLNKMINNARYLITKQSLFSIAVATMLSACGLATPDDPQQSELPRPLSQAEPIASLAAGGCAAGGLRLYYGLDYNGDGHLGVYERHREETICNPAPLENSPATGVALSKKPKISLPEGG